MNFEKLQKVNCWIIFIILFINVESVSAQYYLSGPTTVYEGSYEYYNITGVNGQEPSDSYFTWTSTVGVLEGGDGYGQLSMAMSFYSVETGEINASWYDDFTYQYYYASTTVEVKQWYPEMPSVPNVLTSDCVNTVLQRGTPPAGVTWYWQSTASGTSTNDSGTTKTVANGTTYYLRARNDNNQAWSTSSSSISIIGSTPPIVGAITQPSAIIPTGSVALSGLPSSGNWVINPGSFTGTGTSTVLTGLAASTTYNFTVTNASGCTSSPSTNVVINASPSSLDTPTLSTVTQTNSTSNTGSFTITNYNPSYSYTASPSEGVIFTGATVTAPQGSYSIMASFEGKTSPLASVIVNTQSIVCEGISNENYIHTIIPQTETTDVSNLTNNEKQESITYFDGLGRPIQKIGIRASGIGNKDVITHIAYDPFDRQTKEYLPYSDDASCGMFRTGNIDVLTKSFYNTSKYENTANPYSEKQFEASPLHRVLKQAAPGNDWKLGNGHEIKMDYKSNLAADEVRNYKVVLTPSIVNSTITYQPVLQNSVAYYAENELYKTVTYDENTTANPTPANELAGSTVEFKNKEGQIVLKRTYGIVGTGSTNERHDTYYVYDDYGNLSFVLPPKMEASTAAITTINNQLSDLGYQYKYDHRNRLVEKKLPGKQWEFIVYDKLDRVVATGPANSPFSNLTSVGWLITKYDVFSRPVLTGWLPTTVNTDTRANLQSTLNGYTANFNETKTATNQSPVNGVTFRYTTLAWPQSGYHVLTVNYYDDYNFPNAPTTIPTAIEDEPVYNNTTAKPKGLPTGTWTRVLQTSTTYANELSYSFYDKKSRPIRNYSTNFLGGYTYTDSKLDFTGKPKHTITRHKRTSGSTELITKDAFTYSPQGRLLTQTHQIGTGTIELIASNTYDELGQLISKKVGNNVNTPTQKVDYAYNIRGWLKGINDINGLQQGSDPKDLFAFKINYNTIPSGISGVDKLYNGNIAETQWATNSDNGIVRAYGYKYDNLNRLREAIYKKQSTVTNLYNESMDYDKNGNIMHLKRYGSLNDSAQTLIDNLTYNYLNSNQSNQLSSVDDTQANNSSFTNEFKNVSGIDYSYDANGNMLKDLNKGIGTTTTNGITYNHLNLPTKITFGTAGNIVYIYNAAGQKVQKVFTQGTSITTTDYLGGYQYAKVNQEPVKLKFFPTAEGYVEYNGSSYKYVYQYKDHLGNVRLSYKNTGTVASPVLEVQEENDYYPFGLKHTGYGYTQVVNSDYKYKYNGKELQDELGLDLYDMSARNYDPAIGRFTTFDPITHYSQSPYSAFNGNPVYWADPSGMEGEHYDWNTGQYVNNAGQSISFEEAMASQGLNANGSKKSDDSNSTSDAENASNEDINPKDAFGYQSQYPRTVQVMKQLHGFVKANPSILKALAEYSGYSSMEVLSQLEYFQGDMTLTIEDLSWDPRSPEGITLSSSDIRLEISNAKHLETLKTNKEIQSFSFFVAITILHEFVHAGRRANGLNENAGEMGWGWEINLFKRTVNFKSANELYKKFNWDFKYDKTKQFQLNFVPGLKN